MSEACAVMSDDCFRGRALEDAAVLGRLVPAPHDAIPDGAALLDALRRDSAMRMPRAHRLAIRSRVGAAGQWSSPIAVAIPTSDSAGWPATSRHHRTRAGHGDRLATAAVTSRRTRREALGAWSGYTCGYVDRADAPG
jgi:hypothetical protein